MDVDEEDNYDIYADLDDGLNQNDSVDDNGAKNCGNNDQLVDNMFLTEVSIMETNMSITQTNNNALRKQNEELRDLLSKRDKLVFVLKTNISSLYKTAKAEIERKNREISELRDEYDSLIFKRITQNKLIKRINSNSNFTNGSAEMCHKATDTRDFDVIKNRRNHTDRYVDNCFRHRKCSRSRSRSRGRRVNSKTDFSLKSSSSSSSIDCRRSLTNLKQSKPSNKR